MTFFDFITANPWALYVLLAFAIIAGILLIGMFAQAYREGRPISLFGIKFDAPSKRPSEQQDAEYDRTIQRSRGFLGRAKLPNYRREVARIRSDLPDQAVTGLALRSHIHHKLLDIALIVGGGFAGISYPGRRLYLEFSTDHLAGMLPEFIDASDQPRLAEKITDFYRITEPNALGVAISDDDFQVSLQLAIYIIRRLEKITRWVNRRRELGEPVDGYTEQDLDSV